MILVARTQKESRSCLFRVHVRPDCSPLLSQLEQPCSFKREDPREAR